MAQTFENGQRLSTIRSILNVNASDINELQAQKAPIASPDLTGSVTVTTNSSDPAVRITQTGAGFALLVEDRESPDNSPFMIDASGRVGIGTRSLTGILTVGGTSPQLDLLEDDGSAGFNNTILIRNADIFAIQTRDGSTFVSNDYRMTSDASGAMTHEWRIGNIECMRIDTSGNVGIGTSSPNSASVVDAQSTTKGVRFPNMTTAQKNAITNVAGNVVFDTTLGKLCVNTGSGWQTITSV